MKTMPMEPAQEKLTSTKFLEHLDAWQHALPRAVWAALILLQNANWALGPVLAPRDLLLSQRSAVPSRKCMAPGLTGLKFAQKSKNVLVTGVRTAVQLIA